MRQFFCLFICLIYCLVQTNAQTIENKGNLSALTQQFLTTPASQSLSPSASLYVVSQINSQHYINAFIKVNNELSESSLSDLGILTGTKAGNIRTIKIPIESVRALALIEKGIEYIELDQPINLNLEAARTKTNVNQVHEGLALPQAYSGKDVVVGILDVGFDYTHPTFYTEDGSTYRVKRIWEQKSTGSPPPDYSYGHEMVDTAEMIAQQSDNPNESHGAHVAGIAAGSGFGGNGTAYRGVAYASDLVLVGITPAQSQWFNTGMTDIVDGINYIFEYAASEGKPAIANLSWGCSIGPHDGSSLFSQAVDNLTGAGKIFTISAGNNGERNLHLFKHFSESDTILRSFINWNSGFPERKTWIDVWGDAGASFCVDLRTYKGPNVSSTTNFICTDDTSLDTFLITSNGDTVFVTLTANIDGLNGKPHAFFDIHSQTNDLVAISVKANSGSAHVWMGYVYESRGYYNEFVTFGFPEASTGDNNYTVGEMACTESAIAVGAYASKVNFVNISGQSLSYATYVDEGDIVPFSSHGPTTDGRYKPDITAPGLTLASALNSFDEDYLVGGSSYDAVVHQYTDASTAHDYYYGELSGTSMSSPMVAGIVALLLEAQPDATPEDIKSILANTAMTDEHTTNNPDPTIWGSGKIDAYAAIQSLLSTGIAEPHFDEKIIYPNPTHNFIHMDLEGTKIIRVVNMVGETCLINKTNDTRISLAELISGVYILTVFDEEDNLLVRKRIIKI